MPTAAFVIPAEDICRSGALALPDVLRMVPGVQVGQIDSGRYAVYQRAVLTVIVPARGRFCSHR